jgi:pimeloyl-ACP methyl ester carboxylesterase
VGSAPLGTQTLTRTDGRVVAWSEFGDPIGAPVLWCHGGLSSRLDIALIDSLLLAAGARVIAPDRPGIGASERRKGRTVRDFADDAAAVADAAGVERFAVAGWSAGGPYALAVAARHPERVRAVATIGGMAPLFSRAQRRELGLAADRMLIPLARRAPWLATIALTPTRYASAKRYRRRLLRSVPAPDRAALEPLPPDRVSAAGLAALRPGVGGTVDDYRAFGGTWHFALHQVRARVRCWQGDADTLVPMAHARRLAAALPGGSLQIVERAGHFAYLTHGGEIFGRLLEDAARAD